MDFKLTVWQSIVTVNTSLLPGKSVHMKKPFSRSPNGLLRKGFHASNCGPSLSAGALSSQRLILVRIEQDSPSSVWALK